MYHLDKQALFFDFDGVLAETMPYHIPAWNRVLEQHYGFSLNPMTLKLNEGRPVFEIIRAIFEDAGQYYDAAILNRVITQKNELFRATHNARVFPEIKEIIGLAKARGLKIGLVTGTRRENIGVIVPDDILDRFDVIIAEGDSERGKPAPDPYLAAAEKVGLAPEDCLVIENAPLGIQAAKSAGMFCFAVKTTLSAEHLAKADVTFNNHADLLHGLKAYI